MVRDRGTAGFGFVNSDSRGIAVRTEAIQRYDGKLGESMVERGFAGMARYLEESGRAGREGVRVGIVSRDSSVAPRGSSSCEDCGGQEGVTVSLVIN